MLRRKISIGASIVLTMVVSCIILVTTAIASDPTPSFHYGNASNWAGSFPVAGDSTFYVDVQGTDLDMLSAEAATWDDSGYTSIAQETDRFYLGRTAVGDDRYICEMTVDGGGQLSAGTIYVRLKDATGTYYDNSNAYFSCPSSRSIYLSSDMPQEIPNFAVTVPFQIKVDNAAADFSKSTISVKLWHGTGSGMFGDVTPITLIGTAQDDDYEISVAGGGQYLLTGSFTVTTAPAAGNTLYAEVSYAGGTAYTTASVHVISATGIGQFKMTNAIPGRESSPMGGHTGGYSASDGATFYLSSTGGPTAHKFTLTGGTALNASLVSVTDNGGASILRAETAVVTGPVNGVYTASGMLDIPNDTTSISIKYNSAEIYSVPVLRDAAIGAAGLACDGEYSPLDMMSTYPANTTTFNVDLSGINLPATGYSALIEDSAVGCSVVSTDGQIKLAITSTVPLNSSRSLKILLNGLDIAILGYNGSTLYENMPGVWENYLFGDLVYTVYGTIVPPAITDIAGNRGLNIYGQGFTSDTVYTAHLIEHTAGGLAAVPQQLTATYVSANKLTISDTLTDTLARGWYEVFLKGNGMQINGFADVALMPASGAEIVVSPTVSLNSGASYTMSQAVTVAMSAGTYSEVRYSEDHTALSSLPYYSIPSSTTLNLSAGYGTKTIYFEFRTAGGNTYSTTATINYRTAAAAPSVCGVVGHVEEQPLLLYYNQSYTVYLQASGTGNVGKVELLDVSDSTISTETLKPTAGTDADFTYSKLLTFSNMAVKKLRFYITDSDGVDSACADITVNVSDAPYILSYRSDMSTEYFDGQYAKNGSTIRCIITGRSGYDGSVTLNYLDAASTAKIAGATLSGAGTYTGTITIPADAARLVSIEYRLEENGLPSNCVTKTEARDMPVTSSLTLSDLPNDSGEFNGKYVRIYSAAGRVSKTVLIETNQCSFTFNSIKEGEYTYSVIDSSSTYISGTISVASGQSNAASLGTALRPATLTFNVTGGTVDSYAYITYRYSVSEQEYLGYTKPAEALKLYEGMNILGYELVLSSTDIRSFTVPAAVTAPFGLAAGVNTKDITVSALGTVSLTVTAQDSVIPGRTIPGASVTVNQTVTNGSRTFWFNDSTTTDENGRCTLTVYAGGATAIAVRKEDYKSAEQDITVTDTASQSAAIALQYGTLNRVKVNMYSYPLLGDGETLDPSKLLETGNRAGYAYARDAAGGELSYYYDSTNAVLVFSNNMSNQTVRVYPSFYLPRYAQQEYYTITLDAHGNGSVDVVGTTGGVITADVAMGGSNPPASYMMVYGSTGRRILSLPGSPDLSTATGSLTAGNYTVIVFSGYELTKLDALSSQEAFDSLGLQQDVHYAKYSVNLENGKTKHLGTVALPTLVTDTMLSVFTSRIEGNFVQGAADGSGGKIYVKAKIMPSELLAGDNLSITSIHVYGDNYSDAAEKTYNGVTSPLGSGTYIPNADGNYVVSYRVNCTQGKVINTMSIQVSYLLNGSPRVAVFKQDIATPLISLIVPTTIPTPASAVTVRGIAYSGSTVEIFEGDTLIGSTVANSYHGYNLLISMLSPERKGAHEIYAKQTLLSGEVYTCEPVTVNVVDRQQGAYIGEYEFINTAHANDLDDPGIRRYTLDGTGAGSSDYYTYSPYGMSRISFTIYNLVSMQFENVCVINTYNGEKFRYPATLVADDPSGAFSKWKVEANLGQTIGNLSVFYSLKDGEDLGLLTGVTAPTQSDFDDSLDNIDEIDPAAIPENVRSSSAAIITEQTSTSLKAYKQFGEGRVGIEVDYSDTSGISEATLIAAGFLKVPVGSNGEFYLIKDSSTSSGSDLTVRRTMYLSQGLADSMTESGGRFMLSPVKSLSADGLLFGVNAIRFDMSAGAIFGASDAARDIAGKVDYIGYLENMGEVTYEAFRGTANLGKLGTGMQVLGGAATATQVFMGPASFDPAVLKEAISKIKNSTVRSRLSDEIYEYQYARRDSHTISSLMGVVSYGSSFFSLPGKCLSYVVSTGSMIYSSKIDSEYNLWGNSILSQIIMQLRIEEKDAGKEDDPDEPKWIMDPSGYVFEAIDSQRISGITATAQTDASGAWTAWNDELLTMSGQVNPQTTNSEGRYGWDVPGGNWRVLFEDSSGDYQAAVTNPMTVPPAHTEVNIGLLATAAPTVSSVTVDPSGLEIEFSMYMQAESIYDLAAGILNVQVNETIGASGVPCGSISYLVSASNMGYATGGVYQNDVISSGTFVKRIRFNADTTLYPSGFKLYEDDGVTAKQYTVTVSGNAVSYAGVPMGSDYTQNDVTAAVRQTAAQPTVSVDEGTYASAQTITLTSATGGAIIYYTTNGTTPTASSLRYTAPITILATTTLKALASKAGMDDSPVRTATYVIDDGSGPLIVATPTSTPAGGTYDGAVSVMLSSTTGEATIYYTLDGSVPSTSSTRYTGLISITGTTTMKAIAIKSGYANSGVLSAVFTINEGYVPGGGGGSSIVVNRVPPTNNIEFSDVPSDHWAQEAIQYVSGRGLFEGTGEGKFSPSLSMTRGMLATVLYRLAGKPGISVESSFADVPEGAWYADPVAWAAALGITSGRGDGAFDPSGEITRQELVTMLYRYMKGMGYVPTEGGNTDFSDSSSISSYAQAAMRWGVSAGIVMGYEDGTVRPNNTATRAEVAAMIARFAEMLEKM